MKKNKIVKIIICIFITTFFLCLGGVIYLRALLKVTPTSSSNMAPSIMPGDKLIAVDIKNSVKDIRRGDIVFYNPVKSPDNFFCSRIVGLPNEEIEIKSGKIFIDGIKINLQEITKNNYINKGKHGEYGIENHKYKIPENSFFLLSDNSKIAMDSRYLGFIPAKQIKRKVVAVYSSSSKALKRIK